MSNYIFRGNPKGYKWDIKLKKGRSYNGDTVAFDDVTIDKLYSMDNPNLPLGDKEVNDKGFSEEWEKVN